MRKFSPKSPIIAPVLAVAAIAAGCSSDDPAPVAAIAAPVIADASDQSLALNVAIAEPIVFANTGGAVASCAVMPNLPAGLAVAKSAGTPASCQISGTPTAITAQASYTITATNASGSESAMIVISVPLAFAQIQSGNNHTCAITNTGRLYCWGRHHRGQLGLGDTGMTSGENPEVRSVLAPQQVGTATDWTSISGSYNHVCAINQAGELHCWGDNRDGQLGIGTNDSGNLPARVGTGTWAAVATGDKHTCAINQAGELHCWGNNGDDRLGLGAEAEDANTPQAVGSQSNWQSLIAGEKHSCATTEDGAELHCWGNNSKSELGLGDEDDRDVPTQVANISMVVSMGAGDEHTCIALGNGQLHCWGANDQSELGVDTPLDDENVKLPASSPTRVGAENSWRIAAAGNNHSCAINNSNELYCWGDNDNGQTGIAGGADPQEAPGRVGGSSKWSIVDGGGNHTCAADTDFKLYCWGEGEHGQLGQGNDTELAEPTLVDFMFE